MDRPHWRRSQQNVAVDFLSPATSFVDFDVSVDGTSGSVTSGEIWHFVLQLNTGTHRLRLSDYRFDVTLSR